MTTATAKTESWDDRIAREKATVDRFLVTLLAVETLLDGWVLEVVSYDESPSYVKFNHTTGACISISLPARYASRNGKVEASASWPKDADGGQKSARDWGLHGYNESDPFVIGFSFKKSAKAIASDLNRRLIPIVLDGIATVNEKLKAQRTEKDGIAVDVDTLTDALPNATIREQLREYKLPELPSSLVLTDIRYVAASGDWYVECQKADYPEFGKLWYWHRSNGSTWVHCPLGPV